MHDPFISPNDTSVLSDTGIWHSLGMHNQQKKERAPWDLRCWNDQRKETSNRTFHTLQVGV